MLQSMHSFNERGASHPTAVDFCKVFTEEMNSLYLLAFLLTADSDKAEQCFVSTLGECVEGSGPFMGRARSWGRDMILKEAARMIMPAPDHVDQLPFVNLNGASLSGEYNYMGAIVALKAFERFVFVMSVLERQSDEDCSTLLGCTRRDVTIARKLAVRRLSHSGSDYDQSREIRLEA